MTSAGQLDALVTTAGTGLYASCPVGANLEAAGAETLADSVSPYVDDIDGYTSDITSLPEQVASVNPTIDELQTYMNLGLGGPLAFLACVCILCLLGVLFKFLTFLLKFGNFFSLLILAILGIFIAVELTWSVGVADLCYSGRSPVACTCARTHTRDRDGCN